MKKIKILFILVLLLLIVPSVTFANDPKDSIPAPPGTNVLLFYYDHISGTDAYSNGDKVSNSTDFNANIAMLRYTYYGQVGKYPWALTGILPYGDMSIDIPNNKKYSASQIGDPIIAGVFWPYANPEKKTWVEFTQYIIPPLGEYTHDKPLCIQMGSNRWSFKEELAIVKGFGPFMIELLGFAQFFTDNDEYTRADLTLEKDNIYHGEAHLIWDVNKTLFLSADYFYDHGGETSAAGISNNDELDDHTAGITVGLHLTPSTLLLLKARDTFKSENCITTKDIGIRLAYFF
ncbi:MAG: hypothetical protein A4E66_01908 [Syntrophus sp. PtaB.Bin001]|nr:MAG: hypothetical protein A4E66_01908 [Syntrophus sp. PtaB.Bin001]